MPRLPKNFRPVLRYTMRGGKPTACRWFKELLAEKGTVYARVYRGMVVYIGKADGTLRARLERHLKGISKPSDQENTEKYRKWAEGKRITIYAYKPDPVTLLDCTVHLHRSLEHALIIKFRPADKSVRCERWFVRRA